MAVDGLLLTLLAHMQCVVIWFYVSELTFRLECNSGNGGKIWRKRSTSVPRSCALFQNVSRFETAVFCSLLLQTLPQVFSAVMRTERSFLRMQLGK